MTFTLSQIDRLEWDRESREFLDCNYRQMWAYGLRAADLIGAKSEHVALKRDGVCAALADVRTKALPVVGGGVAYVNGGPLVRRRGASLNDHAEALSQMLDALKNEYVRRRGMVLRIVGTLGDDVWNERQAQAMSESGFEPTAASAKYRTMLVKLDGKLEALRAGLAQKWRNCLNNAERQGVTIEVSRDTDSLARFGELYEKFVERKGLEVAHDAAFFLKVQEGLEGDDRLVVQLARRESQLIAGHVSSMAGDTCVYLLGATAPEGLTTKAAYLIQWNTIKLSHEGGLAYYDLGGIDPDANPGVFHFKKGMSGIDRTAPGPFEATPQGLRGRVTLSTERLYRRLKARKTKAPALKSEPAEAGQEKSQ